MLYADWLLLAGSRRQTIIDIDDRAGDRSLARHLGVALNVVCGVSRISMEQVIKGVWPFMIAQLVALF
jgi:hypothetical protein